MNLSALIKQYFPTSENDVTIDVFDEKNIYDVYHRVVNILTRHMDIETTVLEAMSSCIVTRTITTKSEFWQKADNSVIIQTKTIESYDGTKKGL